MNAQQSETGTMGYDHEFSEVVGEMYSIDSDQYGCGCVVALWGDSPDAVIAYCRETEAVVTDPDGEMFCVVLRPDVGPELWSENALRRSLSARIAP